VDLYNRAGNDRQLEAFIVHATIAWLKLLQAKGERDGVDLYVRQSNGRRIRTKDGLDWVFRSLDPLAEEILGAKDPRLASLRFFIGLRNRIEHRFEPSVAAVVAGRTQAWILGYERALCEWFGDDEGLADELRFPLFLSSITSDAVESVKQVRSRVPTSVIEWLQDFDSSLEPGMTADQQFDFRIYLIPHTGPKTDADAAMTFVRMEGLTDEQRAVMAHVQTIIREKHVPVGDAGKLKPGQVASRVTAALKQPFTIHDHVQAARHFDVRPPGHAPVPTLTKSEFCTYNSTFEAYAYSEAWVSFLMRKLASGRPWPWQVAPTDSEIDGDPDE
jgi:hypothetical protein